MFWIRPGRVLDWTMCSTWASVNSRMSSRVLHHSSATILTREPLARRASVIPLRARSGGPSPRRRPAFDGQLEVPGLLFQAGQVVGDGPVFWSKMVPIVP